MRSCPRCTFPLTPYTHAEYELDHCHRCEGSFLDPGKAAEQFGPETNPEFWKQSHATKSSAPSDLRCPRCGEGMDAYTMKLDGHELEVDDCPKCHGMWLDQNEGPLLRAMIANAEALAEERRERKGTIKGYLFQLLTQFPVEVWNPVRQRPWIVYGTLLTLLGLWLWEWQLTESFAAVAQHCLMVPASVGRGDYPWTIVSAGFFHASWMHLIGNAWFLWIFGDNVEDTLGRKHFVLLYLAALVAGNLAHLAVEWGSPIPLLGASGAISGLLGAYLVLFPRAKVWMMIAVIRLRVGMYWYAGVWIGLQILMMKYTDAPVAWFAHFGGFAAGVAYALAIKPSIRHRLIDPHPV